MNKRMKDIEERQELKKWRKEIDKIQEQINKDLVLVDELIKAYS